MNLLVVFSKFKSKSSLKKGTKNSTLQASPPFNGGENQHRTSKMISLRPNWTKAALAQLFLIVSMGVAQLNAQTGLSVNMSISVEVLSGFSVTKLSDMDFGPVPLETPGPVFLSSQEPEYSFYVGPSASKGMAQLDGPPGATFIIYWNPIEPLSNGEGSTIYFYNYVSGTNLGLNVYPMQFVWVGNNESFVTNAEGEYYLSFGGKLGPTNSGAAPLTSDVAPGVYTGSTVYHIMYY